MQNVLICYSIFVTELKKLFKMIRAKHSAQHLRQNRFSKSASNPNLTRKARVVLLNTSVQHTIFISYNHLDYKNHTLHK